MYYLIYIPLYLLSLLPLQVLYLLGDFAYFILHYVMKYRRNVVMSNLKQAFPEKTEEERARIAKQFYRNFTDTFIETIKFLSWSMEDVDRRLTIDLSGFEAAYACGKSVHGVGMHNFNWEFVNWGLARKMKYPFVGIYMPMGNKIFDRIMYNMRARQETILIPATDFKSHYIKHSQKTHVMASAADQSPGRATNAYWIEFFGKPTAFVTGMEKGARLNDVAMVFAHFYKLKRGHYRIVSEFITDDVRSLPEGELTVRYARFIEKCLRLEPSNYLWSHRRWKLEYKPEYGPVLS